MSTRYRILREPEGWPDSLPFPGYKIAGGVYRPGDVCEVDWSPEDAQANLDTGIVKPARWWQGRLRWHRPTAVVL